MSEKWRSTQFGTDVYCESQSSPIAMTCKHELAQQIVREHNTVPVLVEALRGCLPQLAEYASHLHEYGHEAYECEVLAEMNKARAALALAEEKP